ncbi:cell division topological specificity factor MinE [Thioclava atlantica]|uniref:Cell division topological specificity factor n=1 Tax=Thioclava atlantica TaxID=1317124 RepID=A0A085TT56_9RHOB|nr:cell division topological specificity factor MinE [Thioclava atlantica]KFE33903.1 cell division topological specificity factor MinE [Thioclava atlantica]
MSLFGFALKPRRSKSAQTAKDRLQILLAHESRSGSKEPDYLPKLQRDIIEVIRKYMKVQDDDVMIRMERENGLSSLEINIEMSADEKKGESAKKKD